MSMPSDIHSVCDIHSAFSGDCLSSSASAGATMHMYCGENAVRSRLLAISHGHVPISAMSRFSRVTPSAFSVEKGQRHDYAHNPNYTYCYRGRVLHAFHNPEIGLFPECHMNLIARSRSRFTCREADPIVHVSATCGTRRTFRWRTGASIDIRTYGAFSMSRKGCTCSATFCRHYITLGSTSRSSPITFRISCHLMQTVTCTPTNALPKFRIQQSTAAGKA
ncbi:hypothetical protein IAQ61_000245 [Plenodomus lingam]|uniref:uncharacterized protein n=1 Tax=Leptosphaeria maculans TaxID=5022 RepID=UPI00331A8C4C|nr:hypothetical protein IAQ61_000245 [Plenodomus lingam]